MRPGTRELRPWYGGRFSFDPGSFCLELLLTGGPPPWDRYEILHTPNDLAEWLTGSRLALETPFTVDDVRIRPAELARIVEFRNALLPVVTAVSHGEEIVAEDIELINAAAGPAPRIRLDPDTLTRSWVPPITGAQVLAAAANEVIDLIGTDRCSRLRQCAGDDCYLMFLDTSRPGNRRWCSMQRCGNRQKVTTFRSRHS